MDTQRGDQDTYRERREGPQKIEAHRSDLADNLKVPYPFDTQANQEQSAREPKPPSPPVQTTPPPTKEPATSLRSSSNVYAVANPEVQRAQGSGYQRQPENSEVRFDRTSQRPPSPSNRAYGGSPVKDRAPTPYAKSPERERLRSPPDWDAPVEQKSREQSNTSKKGLPPQHAPLDTLHSTGTSKPGSRGSKVVKQEDSQSIKRVYVESPSFTKEEEDQYRFVSSRLEDTDDRKQDTVREMDNRREMDNKHRGYGGDDNPRNSYSEAKSKRDTASYSDNKSRRTGSEKRTFDKDRYEDRNQEQYAGRDKNDVFYKDRYEDRHHELNGAYEDRERADRYAGSKRYEDKYDRLRDERAEYDREPRREDETELGNGYGRQFTDMDERDLRKEKEYQSDLKRRIDKQSKKLRNSEKYNRTFNKENDLRRDSLEYPQDERDIGFVQDSLEYNNYDRQPEWENPPQNPYQEGPGYFPGGFVKQDSKPDFYDPEDVEKMDIVHPKAPKYDYVEHNKHDYGKIPKMTYRDIEHKKKEEEEKLDHIFITPKVPKPKKKHKKAQSAQPEHMGYQVPDQYPVGFKPSSAEELWAQRAKILSEKKGSAGSGKAAKSASKSVPRWNSNPQVKQPYKFEVPPPLPNQGQLFKPTGAYQPGNAQDQGGYSQTHGGFSTPTRHLQPLENRPAAPVSHEIVPAAVKPSSPFRRHLELKPITQEITTEDGQRISVDINLRLISPPPAGSNSPTHHQQLALVPVQETQGQGLDQRGVPIGVPYQMQDQYTADVYYPGYVEEQMYQGNQDHLPMDTRYHDITLTADEIAQIDPSGYSKRYQPGSVSFKDDQTSNDWKSIEEGYAALYHKMKNKDPGEHPWYKIYNLNDYKKMQREVRLNRGTLGPDLDTESYRDKMEKRHKQFEYARMVMEKNRMELGHKKPPKFPRQPEKSGEEGMKRKTALEYAKNVPKPATKPRPNQYNSYEVAAQLSPGSNKHRTPLSSKASPPPTQTVDVIDIRTLEQRHLQERQKADKIRQNMDSVLTQKAH